MALDIIAKLLGELRRSTKQIPPRFVALATQKNTELTKTDGPNSFNSIKAKETNDENPALRIMIAMMSAVLSWKMGCGRAEDACMNKLPKNPKMFKKKIIDEFENWNRLDIQTPKLQNTAEDRLAYSPTSAISL